MYVHMCVGTFSECLHVDHDYFPVLFKALQFLYLRACVCVCDLLFNDALGL